MTQFEQMQQVISNYVKNFQPESYRFFTTFGISPEHLNPNKSKELPEEQVNNMRKAFDSIKQQTKNNGSMFYEQKTAETDDWMYFGFSQDEYTKMKSSDLNCRIYLPIAEGASHDYFMSECLKILVNSEIKFTGKVAKTYRNDSLMFEFEEKEQAKKFVELFMKREDLRGMLGQHNPFLRDVQGLGFVDFQNFDPTKQSYTSVVSHELEDYVYTLQAEDMKKGKDKASVEGFKEFLEKEKTNPNKNPKMLDQIIGEIEHCKSLHLQSLKNVTLDPKLNTVIENSSNKATPPTTKKESRNLQPKTIGASFTELKSVFESYKLVEGANGVGLVDRKTGQYVTKDNNLQQLVEKATLAKKWIEAAGVDLSLSGGVNEFGIDPKQYEMAFNDGARQTFEAMFNGLAKMGQNGQNFDLNNLQQFVLNGTGYKYSSSLIKGLLANPQGEEVNLPQNQGIPTKKPWEYGIIKHEIENIALSNQLAKTNTVTQTSQVQPQPATAQTSQVQPQPATAQTSQVQQTARVQTNKVQSQVASTQTSQVQQLIKTQEEIQKQVDNELSKSSQSEEASLKKQEQMDYLEKQRNKPKEDERERIYDLGLKVTLLKERMSELSQKGSLKDIPDKYTNAINNTIQNLINLSDKTIVGKSGQEKSVTEVIGKLWDMRSQDAIKCVENQLSSGEIQDEEVKSILQDFMITKKLIPEEYTSFDLSCMPRAADYSLLHDEWKEQFVEKTDYCLTTADVYKKLDSQSNGQAHYFFLKNKELYHENPKEFINDDISAKKFLEQMKEGISELESTDNLSM